MTSLKILYRREEVRNKALLVLVLLVGVVLSFTMPQKVWIPKNPQIIVDTEGRTWVRTQVCAKTGLLPNPEYCEALEWRWILKEEIPKEVCTQCIPRVDVLICTDSGLLANPWCPHQEKKRFRVDNQPTKYCDIHKKPPEMVERVVCAESGKLARSLCPKVEKRKYEKGKEPKDYCPHHKKLEVVGDELYFGGERIFLVGVSRREALVRAAGQEELDWGQYSLTWYENEIIKYGLNYVRHDICNDYQLLRKHCQKMWHYGIIVELTLCDGNYNFGNPREAVESTKDLGNIIYEVWNEMYSPRDVNEAVALANTLSGMGLIVSGGAIGAGGEKYADMFYIQYPVISISQVHRHWPYQGKPENDWILKYVNQGRPVGRNEYFDRGELGLSNTEYIMEQSFKHGARLVNYYGFRMPGIGLDEDKLDPEPYWKYLQMASEICKRLNNK